MKKFVALIPAAALPVIAWVILRDGPDQVGHGEPAAPALPHSVAPRAGEPAPADRRGALLTGQAGDAAIKVVAPFEVSLWRRAARPRETLLDTPRFERLTTQAFTDSEGRFRLPLPPAGDYRVDVTTGDGYSGSTRVQVRQAASAHVVVRLGFGVSGRVVDDATGAPLEGAEVSLSRKDVCDTTRTYADAAGHFRIAGIRESAPTSAAAPLELRIKGHRDVHVSEVVAVNFARRNHLDLGTVKLIKGSWKTRPDGGGWGLTGLWHGEKDGKVYVTTIRPGQPADKAGVRVGDELIAIDGRTASGLRLKARSYLLMGPSGTPVAVTVRTGDAPPRTLTLIRQRRANPAADGQDAQSLASDGR